jgi:hypothetical protein
MQSILGDVGYKARPDQLGRAFLVGQQLTPRVWCMFTCTLVAPGDPWLSMAQKYNRPV